MEAARKQKEFVRRGMQTSEGSRWTEDLRIDAEILQQSSPNLAACDENSVQILERGTIQFLQMAAQLSVLRGGGRVFRIEHVVKTPCRSHKVTDLVRVDGGASGNRGADDAVKGGKIKRSIPRIRIRQSLVR